MSAEFDPLNVRRLAESEFRTRDLINAIGMVDVLKRLSERPGFEKLRWTSGNFRGLIERALNAESEYAARLTRGDYDEDVEHALTKMHGLIDREAEFLEFVEQSEHV